MTVTEDLTETEISTKRNKASRRRRVKALREIWTVDLLMVAKLASDALKGRGEASEDCIETVLGSAQDPQTANTNDEYATWPLDKKANVQLVPDVYALAVRDTSHGFLVITPVAVLVKQLITRKTLDDVEQEQGELAAIRAALEDLAMPNNDA